MAVSRRPPPPPARRRVRPRDGPVAVPVEIEDADAALAAGEEGVGLARVEEDRVRRDPGFRRRVHERVRGQDPVRGERGEEPHGQRARGREDEATGGFLQVVGGVERRCVDGLGAVMVGVRAEGSWVRGREQVGRQDEGAEDVVGGGGEDGGAVGRPLGAFEVVVLVLEAGPLGAFGIRL